MIFVNGLQRSGTNFSKMLFKNNVDYAYPYWKHENLVGLKILIRYSKKPDTFDVRVTEQDCKKWAKIIKAKLYS